MKSGLEKMVGKTVIGVFAAERESTPRRRAFLFFSDGTSMEFYGNDFNCANSLDEKSTWVALQDAERTGGTITNLCLPQPPSGQT